MSLWKRINEGLCDAKFSFTLESQKWLTDGFLMRKVLPCPTLEKYLMKVDDHFLFQSDIQLFEQLFPFFYWIRFLMSYESVIWMEWSFKDLITSSTGIPFSSSIFFAKIMENTMEDWMLLKDLLFFKLYSILKKEFVVQESLFIKYLLSYKLRN